MAPQTGTSGGSQGERRRGAGESPKVQTADNKIRTEIQRIKNAFGPSRDHDSRDVPFGRLARLLEMVEDHLQQSARDETASRMLQAAEKIERTVETLIKKTVEGPKSSPSYAQAARRGAAEMGTSLRQPQVADPPKENPIKERQLIVRIPNADEANALRKLSTKALVERISNNIGDGQRAGGVIAARQLPSGDVQVNLASQEEKRRLEKETSWTGKLGASATIKKKTYRVLVHGMRVADFPRDAGEANARLIESENQRLHQGLRVLNVAWTYKVEGTRDYSSLMVEVDSAEHANSMIDNGTLHNYDLKTTELYDPMCRISQCFKCQAYGHISWVCRQKDRCGACGGQHPTRNCAEGTRQTPRRCAACGHGNHPAWAKECPARAKEEVRAQLAQKSRARYYAVPSKGGPIPIRSTFDYQPPSSAPRTQLAGEDPEPGWVVVAGGKKRKTLKGRPPGSTNKPRDLTALVEGTPGIDAFLSQLTSTATSKRTASDAYGTPLEGDIEPSSTPLPDTLMVESTQEEL